MDLPVEQPLANRQETVAMNLVPMLKTDPFLTPFLFFSNKKCSRSLPGSDVSMTWKKKEKKRPDGPRSDNRQGAA